MKLKRTLAILVAFLFIVIPFNYLPEHEFAFYPTPQNGQVGGLSGVYVYENALAKSGECPYSYEVFQFFDDGTLLDVLLCSDEDIIKSWSDIKKWFHRDTEAQIARGEYFISGKQIWFSTTVYYTYDKRSVTNDYLGTFSENNLILDLHSHYNDHKEKNRIYFKIDVEP